MSCDKINKFVTINDIYIGEEVDLNWYQKIDVRIWGVRNESDWEIRVSKFIYS